MTQAILWNHADVLIVVYHAVVSDKRPLQETTCRVKSAALRATTTLIWSSQSMSWVRYRRTALRFSGDRVEQTVPLFHGYGRVSATTCSFAAVA